MLMMDHFELFDFDEPLVFFILDYMAVMGLFVIVEHYLITILRKELSRK